VVTCTGCFRLWSAKNQGENGQKIGNITVTSQRAALKAFDGKTTKWKGSHLISPYYWTIHSLFIQILPVCLLLNLKAENTK
jgi:hypothetical protein